MRIKKKRRYLELDSEFEIKNIVYRRLKKNEKEKLITARQWLKGIRLVKAIKRIKRKQLEEYYQNELRKQEIYWKEIYKKRDKWHLFPKGWILGAYNQPIPEEWKIRPSSFYCFVKFLSILFLKDIGSILIKKNKQIHIFLKNTCWDVIFFFKNNAYFAINQLLDFTVVDRLEMAIKKNKRFEFVYVFLSTLFNYRIFIRGFISIFESLKSLSNLFNSANWLEREVWDLFGIFIVNHPDLRRILTDYGFLGFPFRKDFPLSGYMELRYDEVYKHVVMEPLELSQEFRYFRFENPWKR